MNHILEVDGVMLSFGINRILQNVYLKCTTGNVTGLLGRNGCGKSCLMKIIIGDPLTEDKSIRINGKSLLGSSRLPEDLRYLPQHNFVPDSLSLERIFDDFEIDIEAFIESFPEFEQYRGMKMAHLSGGVKRILELYLVLKSKSKFVILDEPFSHIMPVHVDTIKNLILEEKSNKGILVSDHLYEHIMQISDEVYMIKNGRTFPIKSVEELHENGYVRLW